MHYKLDIVIEMLREIISSVKNYYFCSFVGVELGLELVVRLGSVLILLLFHFCLWLKLKEGKTVML